MSEARPRVWKTPANVPLCPEAELADPGARSFVLQIGEAFFHGFVVRKDGQVAGYVDRCPHQGGSGGERGPSGRGADVGPRRAGHR